MKTFCQSFISNSVRFDRESYSKFSIFIRLESRQEKQRKNFDNLRNFDGFSRETSENILLFALSSNSVEK